MHQQRYVSSELTHFVGASLRPDEEAQYDLFRRILRSGVLKKGSSGAGFFYALSPIADDLGESLQAPMVCFCDIPVEDLQLHSAKYGRFGVAFRKDLLARKGATPVFYVVSDAPTLPMLGHIFHFDRPREDRGDWKEPTTINFAPYRRRDVFEVWKYATTMVAHKGASASSPGVTSYEFMQGPWWGDFLEFFSLYVFGYVKYMEVGLEESDARNFYMEREWRVLHEVVFTIEEVTRVVIPEQYARRFRVDFPEYFGQVSFIE